MSNSFFQFKQFSVHQDRCAMKVCTDACLFGSVLPQGNYERALDIGAGTGLLSLMFAQKNPHCFIDSIEIEPGAAGQAKGNFELSPWRRQLRLVEDDIVNYAHKTTLHYDIVFCNPPFHKNHLPSSIAGKNIAHHGFLLPVERLVPVVEKLITQNGIFAVLLPFERAEIFKNLCAKGGLLLQREMLVRQTPEHKFFRSILFFSFMFSTPTTEELTIKDASGDYSSAFKVALKDYYLYL